MGFSVGKLYYSCNSLHRGILAPFMVFAVVACFTFFLERLFDLRVLSYFHFSLF